MKKKKDKDSYWLGISILFIGVLSLCTVMVSISIMEKLTPANDDFLASAIERNKIENVKYYIESKAMLEELHRNLTGRTLFHALYSAFCFTWGCLYIIMYSFYRKWERRVDEMRKICFPDAQKPEEREFRFLDYKMFFFITTSLLVLGVLLPWLAGWAVWKGHSFLAWGAAIFGIASLLASFTYSLAFRFHKQLEWKIDALANRLRPETLAEPQPKPLAER